MESKINHQVILSRGGVSFGINSFPLDATIKDVATSLTDAFAKDRPETHVPKVTTKTLEVTFMGKKHPLKYNIFEMKKATKRDAQDIIIALAPVIGKISGFIRTLEILIETGMNYAGELAALEKLQAKLERHRRMVNCLSNGVFYIDDIPHPVNNTLLMETPGAKFEFRIVTPDEMHEFDLCGSAGMRVCLPKDTKIGIIREYIAREKMMDPLQVTLLTAADGDAMNVGVRGANIELGDTKTISDYWFKSIYVPIPHWGLQFFDATVTGVCDNADCKSGGKEISEIIKLSCHPTVLIMQGKFRKWCSCPTCGKGDLKVDSISLAKCSYSFSGYVEKDGKLELVAVKNKKVAAGSRHRIDLKGTKWHTLSITCHSDGTP